MSDYAIDARALTRRFGTFTDQPVANLAPLQRRSSGPWD